MDPFLIYITLLIFTGIFVGFATGLLGVGGGFILAPVQFFLLQSLGVSPDIAIRTAFGTSLAVIFPTALSGAYGHYNNRYVLVKPAVYMGIAGFVGGTIGAFFTANIPAYILQFLFGILLIFVSLHFLRFKNIGENNEKILEKRLLLFWGFIAGFFSGLLGIGGGVVLVPIFVLLLGFSMLEAVGTSTAVIVITSIGGIISYAINGLSVSGLPAYSIGYINLFQLVILAGFSIPMARIGANTAQKLPEKHLRIIFVGILIFIALKMLGLFDLLGINI
ncbi:sulfite exporter TauE/SafE family protein [Methanobacterium alcaliphilum]|uniref:sulfite exporter TauE/SafE family protein n=1 Tax=Methanobacterium alcaliphilum TaxID=392018 RepID=UPI00200B4237|nr:sulfite exporter TauE/SafE family protein [Methanobacterium alcaliphilum]MCK9150945.1 sulfite exporter TauE/SafE family protein [Methanobacterium alcaliphilum]